MKEIHSHTETDAYLPRWLEPVLARAVASHPVVVLTGARQVGKSTLLQRAQAFRGWHYLTLDDLEPLLQAEQAPADLWAGHARVIVDEAQRVPGLLTAIKRAVDQDPGRRFVVSGSANLLLMRRVSESLAGRAVYFVLPPMTVGEQQRAVAPPTLEALLQEGPAARLRAAPARPDPWTLCVRGFMPRLLRLPAPVEVAQWWDGYIATYLERDLRQLSHVASLGDYRRVMAALALRTGQILNLSTVARECQVPGPTAHRYLNLLETTHLVTRVPGYTRNRGKRLAKAPKLFWVDAGLAAHLAGWQDAGALARAREAGAMFETLVFHHVRSLAELLTPRPRLYHWRTATGAEVDLVLEQGRRLLPVEIKATTTPRWEDTRGLRAFLADYPEAVGGVLVHAGDTVVPLGERLVAIPWTALASG